MICCVLAACKKREVDFSCYPTEPKAGEQVKFTNLSSSGEDWEWQFGDGSTSTIKTPSHTYKKPGTYLVVLKVDNKNSLRASKELTVYDTVPTFVCADSVFTIYRDYTFTANLYNPYGYEVRYEWYFPSEPSLPESGEAYAVVTDTTMTNSTLHLYFTEPREDLPLGLRVTLNGETTVIEKQFTVQDVKTRSMCMRTPEQDWRQRIFGERAGELIADASVTPILDAGQDTAQSYNGKEFRLSELKSTFDGIEGFRIANRKIYYRADGLWVANIDGAYPVQIDSKPCPAMTLDITGSRVCWANADGVWYMPLIGSDNNRFVTVPTQLNDLSGVTKLAIDNELK